MQSNIPSVFYKYLRNDYDLIWRKQIKINFDIS